MKVLYQLLNNEYQPVKIFTDLDIAKSYLADLQKTFDENFYIIELSVVYAKEKA